MLTLNLGAGGTNEIGVMSKCLTGKSEVDIISNFDSY